MTPQEKLLLKERLELILPDWTINDDLDAITREVNNFIIPAQTNQILKLGLIVSGVYPTVLELRVEFSELNM